MEKLRGQLYVYKALRKTSGLELYVYKALRKNSGHELYVYKALRKNSGPELYVYKALRKNSGPELYVYKAPRKNSETNCTCTKHFGKTELYLTKAPKNSGTELSTDFYLRNFSEADCPWFFVFGIFPKMIDHRFLSSEFFRGRLYTDFCEIIFAWCD
ncbi:MAG: hypothetical protein IPI53_03870 [Saprospiraceae bacterium]|nr:hypothetical protein [Saprospiraceae bacterium]